MIVSVCVCVCLTEVVRYVLHVWLDDSRMKVLVMSEQLQISGIIFKIRLKETTAETFSR